MGQEFLAVNGLTIDHNPGSTVSAGHFNIISVPSSKLKIKEKGVYKSGMLFAFSGGNAVGFVDGSVQTSLTSPFIPITTNAKNKSEGIQILKENDVSTMICIGIYNPSQNPPTGPVNGAFVKITDANQDKVLGI